MNSIWINVCLIALACSCLAQESNLKMFLYSVPEPTSELLAPTSSERVYYANAPYSVFHTQINVQSQDSEYSTGPSNTNSNATLIPPVAAQDVNPVEQGDSSATIYLANPLPTLAYASNSNAVKAFQRSQTEGLRTSDMRYLRTTNPNNVYISPADNIAYVAADSNRQNIKMRWIMSPYSVPENNNQYNYEDTNLQGINVLNSDLSFIPQPNLPKIHTSTDNNIQGVNVLNSNIYDLTPSLHDILGLHGLGSSPQSVIIMPDRIEPNAIQQADANEIEESLKQTSAVEAMEIVYLPPVETLEKHEDKLLHEDGYHYKKPSIAFVY